MKRGIALLLFVAAAGLLVVLWRSVGGARRGTEVRPVGSTPGRAVEAKDAVLLAPREIASARRAEPVKVEERGPAAPPAEPEPAAVRPDGVAHVRGRCVDGTAHALADVKITGAGIASGQRSAVDGRFELEVDLSGALRVSSEVRFARSGLGTRRVRAHLRSGDVHDLGDVVLVPAGSVSGRVRDEDGRPLGGARVSVEEGLDLSSGSRFTGPERPIATGSAAESGHFLVEDVPAGAVRVWAGKEEWQWSSTERLELAPGGRLDGLELVCEPLAPEDTIRLVVLDPAGAPVPHAKIQYRYELAGNSGMGDTQADENGRFVQFLDVRASYSFLASDPENRYRPAAAHDVPPAKHDLVLKLGEKRTFRLRVEDGQDAPIERFGVSLLQKRDHFQAFHQAPDDGIVRAGVVELIAPPEPFEVTVEAEGFEVAELGRFDPEDLPAELVARLRRLPGVRGCVTSASGPIAGAVVSLHEAMGPKENYVVNGFRCLSSYSGEQRTQTDEKGEYVLTLRSSGDWTVRAEAPGLAPGDLGPLHLEASVGASGVDLVLGRGGTIAGRVIVVAGEDPSGRIVGLSRGDGRGFTGRTDAAGEFRFEGLTPGPWQVVWRKDEISTNSTTSSRGSGREKPAEIPWDCVVHEGRVTHFDLDLRALALATLSGRFLLGGSAPRDWSARLSQRGAATQDESVSLDPDGRFRLTTANAGSFTLTFTGKLGGAFASATTKLELVPGENVYEADVPAGGLSGRLFLGSSVPDTPLWFVSDAYPGLLFRTSLRAGSDGSFAAELLPAGSARLEYRTATDETRKKEIEVPRGRTVEVDLP